MDLIDDPYFTITELEAQVSLLREENESLWFMIEELKKSEVKEHKELIEKETNRVLKSVTLKKAEA
jgi:hypothetical protein